MLHEDKIPTASCITCSKEVLELAMAGRIQVPRQLSQRRFPLVARYPIASLEAEAAGKSGDKKR